MTVPILRMFFDERGYASAVAPPPYEPLAWFLASDIQGDVDDAARILEGARRIAAGEQQTPMAGTGNSMFLEIGPSKVLIETEFAIPAQRIELSHEVFAAALEAWRRMLKTRQPQSIELPAGA